MTRTVIIGGGLAGGGVAARLAHLGHPALVLEREAGAHDKICGEFLSVEAGQHLAALGLDVARLGGARIDTMRLHVGRRVAEARLPFVATGVTRRALDGALLDHAAAVGRREDAAGLKALLLECGVGGEKASRLEQQFLAPPRQFRQHGREVVGG